MGVHIVSGSQPLPEAEISVWGNFSLGGNICDTVDGGRYGGCCGCKHKFQGGVVSHGEISRRGKPLSHPYVTLRHMAAVAAMRSKWPLRGSGGRRSIVFLPRYAYAQRVLCRGKMSVRPSVCLSVCPPVTRRYCV